jgi:hypothetical protein
MSVIPYFELHIRPMFRVIDCDHMSRKVDLRDYDKVKAMAPRIQEMLRKPPPVGMPTKASGGPWPEGWIQVFESWIAEGFPRLLLAEGQYNARRIGSGQIILNGSVQVQNGAADAWLQRELIVPNQADFTLYLRPAPAGVQEPQRTMPLGEVLDSTIQKIMVHDAAGQHEVTIAT